MGGCHGTFVGDVRRLNGLGGTAVSHAEFVQRVRGLQYRELTPDDYDLLSQLDEMIPRRNVVPASVVGNLPCISARDFDQQSCTICQGDFTPTERLAKLPCQHAFHQHCIGRWLTQHRNSCPLCAAVIEPLESSRDCGCSAIDAPGETVEARTPGAGSPHVNADTGSHGADLMEDEEASVAPIESPIPMPKARKLPCGPATWRVHGSSRRSGGRSPASSALQDWFREGSYLES
eukprot:TRINITY_DN13130_c0_g1_i1.p1 TRINITY_DN13130_c0_g1~~TRINITY_DN13130_c0_g1_i1.p1  ORF type:complete len:258 (-),score=26.88 TRINITY_DN13130_c0_g1_i1:167-865(-)